MRTGGGWLAHHKRAVCLGTSHLRCSCSLQMGEAFGYAISTQWPDAPGWLWERSGEWGQGGEAKQGGNQQHVGAAAHAARQDFLVQQ